MTSCYRAGQSACNTEYESDHPYVTGHYLTFVPRDRADQNYRVIFETYEGKVTAYRAGRVPEIGQIEGCS